MTGDVIVFGAAYSVYVKIVRLTLEEKGVPYPRSRRQPARPGTSSVRRTSKAFTNVPKSRSMPDTK
jgi:hypothetical protein